MNGLPRIEIIETVSLSSASDQYRPVRQERRVMLAPGKTQRRRLIPNRGRCRQINDFDDIGGRKGVRFQPASDKNDLSDVVHHGWRVIAVAGCSERSRGPSPSVARIKEEALGISAAHEYATVR